MMNLWIFITLWAQCLLIETSCLLPTSSCFFAFLHLVKVQCKSAKEGRGDQRRNAQRIQGYTTRPLPPPSRSSQMSNIWAYAYPFCHAKCLSVSLQSVSRTDRGGFPE